MYLNEGKRNGLVGFWWYTPSKNIIGTFATLEDAERDGNYYQYSNHLNHLSVWKDVVATQVNDENERNKMLRNGYRGTDRGRVVYDTRTGSYEVTCSMKLAKDSEFRDKIISAYNLKNDEVDFVPLRHYEKHELTGNPFLDSFEDY